MPGQIRGPLPRKYKKLITQTPRKGRSTRLDAAAKKKSGKKREELEGTEQLIFQNTHRAKHTAFSDTRVATKHKAKDAFQRPWLRQC